MVDKYRYLLLTRNRIVTRQDIKALCYTIFSKKNINNIELKKTTVSGLGYVGLHQALRIMISLSKGVEIDKAIIERRIAVP